MRRDILLALEFLEVVLVCWDFASQTSTWEVVQRGSSAPTTHIVTPFGDDVLRLGHRQTLLALLGG